MCAVARHTCVDNECGKRVVAVAPPTLASSVQLNARQRLDLGHVRAAGMRSSAAEEAPIEPPQPFTGKDWVSTSSLFSTVAARTCPLSVHLSSSCSLRWAGVCGTAGRVGTLLL